MVINRVTNFWSGHRWGRKITDFNRRGIFASKRGKFDVLFAWPLIFYRQKLCKIIFAYLKNLFSLICGFRIPDSGFRIPDSGFRIPDSGFRIPDSGFRIPDSGFRIPDSEFRIQNSGFRIPDSGFRIPVSGFRFPVSTF